MRGKRTIGAGALLALAVAILAGCAVPLPFIQAPAPSSPPAPAVAVEADVQDPQPATLPEPPPDPVVSGPDLWTRIGNGITLGLPDHRDRRAPLRILRYGKRFMESGSANAAPYLHHIVHEIERRQLPVEIALIPLLESGYNAAAGRHGGPSGLWQFIPATGRRFGLRVDAAYDGRRDVVGSTAAALDYLEHLRDEFDGDWLLAFAAYNCGERTVATAIAHNRRRGRATDFWALALPRVTREYIPRLLAAAEIVAAPQAYGVELAVIPDRPVFETIEVGSGRALQALAAASGFDRATFDQLNRPFRQSTTVGGVPVLVRHGTGHAAALAAAALPVTSVAQGTGDASGTAYRVRSGDTLSGIAARHGVSIAALRAANGLRSTRLHIDQHLVVPQRLARTAAPVGRPAGAGERLHVVRAGDNVWDLARHYGVSTAALLGANELGPRTVLRLGQRLHIPASLSRGRRAARLPTVMHLALDDTVGRYEVQAGDSLWTISRRFKVSVDDLRKWNDLGGGHRLHPGQRLVIDGET